MCCLKERKLFLYSFKECRGWGSLFCELSFGKDRSVIREQQSLKCLELSFFPTFLFWFSAFDIQFAALFLVLAWRAWRFVRLKIAALVQIQLNVVQEYFWNLDFSRTFNLNFLQINLGGKQVIIWVLNLISIRRLKGRVGFTQTFVLCGLHHHFVLISSDIKIILQLINLYFI